MAAVQQAARESDQLREITIAGQGLHHAATAADRLAIDPDLQVGASALHVDGGQRPATVVKAHTVPPLLRQGRWGIRPVMGQRYRCARLGIGRCERWAEQGTRLLQHLHGRAVLRIHRRHAEEQQGQDQPIRHGGRRIRESRTATHPRVQGVHRPARAPYSATESATQTQNNHHVCHTIDCPTHPGLGCGIHTDLLLRLGTNARHSRTRSLTPS